MATPTSATLIALQKKLGQVQDEREQLLSKINALDQQKRSAVENEDYDKAAEIKDEIDSLQELIKQKDSQVNKLNQGINAEMTLLEQKRGEFMNVVPTSSVAISSGEARLKQRYDEKRNELTALKAKAVNDEDYDKANYYKEQIEQLEANFKKDLDLSERKVTSSSSSSNTPSVAAAPAVPTVTPTLQKSGSSRDRTTTMRKQYDQDSRLYDAARSSRIQEVKKGIEEDKIDVNSIDFTTGNSALHAACTVGCKPIILYLVEQGAEINLKNRRGQTPLHNAIEKRLDDVVRFLIENGGDARLPDNTGKTPYDFAATAPQYQLALREFLSQQDAKKRAMQEQQDEAQVEPSRSEIISVYLRTGTYHSFQINEKDGPGVVIPTIATKLGITAMIEHLEMTEETMGKERPVKSNESLLLLKDKWPNSNPTYCKFMLKLKRGSPSDAQMKFREAMYAKK